MVKSDSAIISNEKALSIAKINAKSFHNDLNKYEIISSLEADGWHVDYISKLDQLGGGGPSYLIDKHSGKIISKHYQR